MSWHSANADNFLAPSVGMLSNRSNQSSRNASRGDFSPELCAVWKSWKKKSEDCSRILAKIPSDAAIRHRSV